MKLTTVGIIGVGILALLALISSVGTDEGDTYTDNIYYINASNITYFNNTNIAYKNESNVFTKNQTFKSDKPCLFMNDTGTGDANYYLCFDDDRYYIGVDEPLTTSHILDLDIAGIEFANSVKTLSSPDTNPFGVFTFDATANLTGYLNLVSYLNFLYINPNINYYPSILSWFYLASFGGTHEIKVRPVTSGGFGLFRVFFTDKSTTNNVPPYPVTTIENVPTILQEYNNGGLINYIRALYDAPNIQTSNNGTLKITDISTVYSSPFITGSGLNVTNRYGMYVGNPTGSNSKITNQYGMYIGALSRATNNYGVYSEITKGNGRYFLYNKGGADSVHVGNIGVYSNSYNISTPVPYPITVNGSTEGISIYTSGNISADEYFTHTTVFDDTKNPKDYIKDSSYYIDSKGEINHSKFYGYIEREVTDYNKPVYIDKIYTETYEKTLEQMIELYNNDTLEAIKAMGRGEHIITQTFTKKEATYPYTTTVKEISINREVDVLRQALYEAIQKIEELEDRVNQLER